MTYTTPRGIHNMKNRLLLMVVCANIAHPIRAAELMDAPMIVATLRAMPYVTPFLLSFGMKMIEGSVSKDLETTPPSTCGCMLDNDPIQLVAMAKDDADCTETCAHWCIKEATETQETTCQDVPLP